MKPDEYSLGFYVYSFELTCDFHGGIFELVKVELKSDKMTVYSFIRIMMVMVLSLSFLTSTGQKTTITGEKKQLSKRGNPELSCVPVKTSTNMKITSVKGNCDGFWIQEGSKTVFKFENMEDAVGTKLSPGIYYVYPYLKKGDSKAKVTITIDQCNKII